jgi:hypothetical protein
MSNNQMLSSGNNSNQFNDRNVDIDLFCKEAPDFALRKVSIKFGSADANGCSPRCSCNPECQCVSKLCGGLSFRNRAIIT